MKRRGIIFGYQHTAFGLALFTLGCGVLLGTFLERMGIGFDTRSATAILLMAVSGGFVRRPTAPSPPAG